MNPYSKKVIELANAFSGVLNQWIPEKLFEVNLRNKEASYVGCCATHDFCDPNQAMIDAFTSVFGREPSAKNQKDNLLINNAWNIAKDSQFKPYQPAAKERPKAKYTF